MEPECNNFIKSIFVKIEAPPRKCGFCGLIEHCNSPLARKHKKETGGKHLDIDFSQQLKARINSEGSVV